MQSSIGMALSMSCFIMSTGILLLSIFKDLCVDYEKKHKNNVMISGIVLLVVGFLCVGSTGMLAFKTRGGMM